MTNWRGLGDVPLSVYESAFRDYNSPMLPHAAAIREAAKPHSALALAMMWVESKYGTLSDIPADHLNPLSQTRTLTEQQDGQGRWKRFPSYVDAVRWWKQSLTSVTGPYRGTVTVADLIHVYAPDNDGNNEAAYVGHIERLTGSWPRIGAQTPMAITFGKVPHPGYLDRPILKAEGQGWDNLGQRQPKFVVLHRMVGSLWGTDGYFRQAGVNALTDYGVGVAAQDGAAQAGVIIRWNDPRGTRSGWASGPVSQPYGDGLAVINKYGIVAVNRDGVSIEISGNYDTAVDDTAIEEIAKLMAYWWDQMQIPHTQAPINPATGISAVIWHQEFTIGTGKVCPGNVVMALTQRLIDRAKAIMKPYQEGTATAPPPTKPAEPPINLPEGLDRQLAAAWFGSVTVGNLTYAFDPAGSVTGLWLANGRATGVWPKLVRVEEYVDSATQTRRYFVFDSGFTVWTTTGKPARVLK